MIGSILLAVDASSATPTTLSYARFLAAKLEANLKAVYVIDSRLTNMSYWTDYGALSVPTATYSEEMNELLQAQGKELLKDVEAQLADEGLTAETEIRTGLPANQILDAAATADLIVLGRRGESSKLEGAGGLGAVVERVIRGSRQPVLVAAERFTPPKRVVLGYDGSERAREAMVYATELAQRLGLPLLAVSVHDDERVALERLETVRAYAQGRKLELKTLPLISDDAVEALLSQLAEGDLLAIGAFGEGRVREWLLGSTTEALLRSSTQPVLLHR
ncbi:MAG: universal stress protein [Deinococcota bacterium]|jgi:nucleotide-binding universal stress UspA family protein|nr:universal stress protein [Deinococcota bacterium]